MGHFSQPLNPSLSRLADLVPNSALSYNTNCDPVSLDEIINVIHHLRPENVLYESGIPAEICNACLPVVIEPLYTLFWLVWGTEKMRLIGIPRFRYCFSIEVSEQCSEATEPAVC